MQRERMRVPGAVYTTTVVKTLLLLNHPSSVKVVKKQRAGRVYMIEGITQGTPLYFKLII